MNGVLAQAVARLRVRVLSALVLAPPVLGAVVYGPPFFDVLVAAGAVILAWEWSRLCGGPAPGAMGLVLGGALLTAVVAAALERPGVSLAILLLGFAAVFGVAAALVRGAAPEEGTGAPDRRLWLAAGVLYIGVPCVALEWMRADAVLGRDIVLWLFAVVWAADSGSYGFGRLIGGPKLAPAISPKKTWAGLLGGIACAGAAGAATAAVLGNNGVAPPAAFGAVLGTVAQGGDLAESWIKRRFGVKDAGTIIPGHGGLLDRVDGLMAAAVVTALIGLLGHGSLLI